MDADPGSGAAGAGRSVHIVVEHHAGVLFVVDQYPSVRSARTLRTKRSANAFARGVRGGVFTTSMPSAANTASKGRGELGVAVADQKLKPPAPGTTGAVDRPDDAAPKTPRHWRPTTVTSPRNTSGRLSGRVPRLRRKPADPIAFDLLHRMLGALFAVVGTATFLLTTIDLIVGPGRLIACDP